MKWMLIDGNNWFARDWYASRGNAAGMFLRRAQDLQAQFGFECVAVAWDSRRSFRKDLSEEYKAHRGPKPEGFDLALPKMKQAVAGSGLEAIEVDGFEADDVLASLVAVAHDEGARAVVFSSDADLHQLIVEGEVTQVTNWARASHSELALTYMTSTKLFTTHGVRPWQWVDYRVIVGDKSDGIRGVEGLGPKAARNVMSSCSTLDAFFQSPFKPSEISDRQRNALLRFRPQVEHSRQLLTLRRDVPLPAAWYQSLAGGAT